MFWRFSIISLLLMQPVLSLEDSLCAMNAVGPIEARACDCCCGAAHAPAGCPCLESDESSTNSATPTPATLLPRTQLTFLSQPALQPVLVADSLERFGMSHTETFHFPTTHSRRTLICVWQT